ncbi:hypothetical protein AB4037_00365 [Labrys sp. KB_33_2]|uniref:hypothetical protein n=1 Tax=unclassified Labrys (in: a-proteobacteria) TaxID=2688601 RepID=UPI003EBEF085
MFDAATQRRLVGGANLAPSVHNTQPARWCFEADGSIALLADPARRLAVGDPEGRDLAVSCGAALEGMLITLAELGLGAGTIAEVDEDGPGGLRRLARFEVTEGTQPSGMAEALRSRVTWRAPFLAVETSKARDLQTWAGERPDVTLVAAPEHRAFLAGLADEASLHLLRDRAFRLELLSWMRLSRSDPAYGEDGMNLDALHLSPIEGFLARQVMGGGLFSLVDRLKLAPALFGERGKTLSAAGIVLFHRPFEETALQSGRAFHRCWLELTRVGLSAWPMAVLADDPDCAGECRRRFGIGDGRRLINALRVGRAGGTVGKARLKAESLLVDLTGVG